MKTTHTRDWINHLMPDPGIERIEAFFRGNAYGLHRHDTYAVGITLSGVQTFNYRRGMRASLPGNTMVLHPDELHDGQAGTPDGFAYRMAYVSPAWLQQALGGCALPFIEGGVSSHPMLRAAAVGLLNKAETDPADGLAAVDGLVDLATALVVASGGRAHHAGDFHAAQRARDCILDSLPGAVTLNQLESASGRDRWSLSRDFRAFFGTSPYRYLTLRRLDLAKRLMLQGQALADCAVAAGFADQSHMTRQFVQAFGLPPARWLRALHGSTSISARTIVQDAG